MKGSYYYIIIIYYIHLYCNTLNFMAIKQMFLFNFLVNLIRKCINALIEKHIYLNFLFISLWLLTRNYSRPERKFLTIDQNLSDKRVGDMTVYLRTGGNLKV